MISARWVGRKMDFVGEVTLDVSVLYTWEFNSIGLGWRVQVCLPWHRSNERRAARHGRFVGIVNAGYLRKRTAMLIVEHGSSFKGIRASFFVLPRLPVGQAQLVFQVTINPHLPDDVFVERIVDGGYILDDKPRGEADDTGQKDRRPESQRSKKNDGLVDEIAAHKE